VRVAFVNNQYQLGGAETVLHQLFRGVTANGHQASIHVAHGRTYPARPEVHPLYPRFLSRLHHSRLHGLCEAFFPRFVWTDQAFQRLADHPADLVHVHNFHGDYATVASLAGLAGRKPCVWTFHAAWGVTGGCDFPGGCERYLAACGACPQVGKWAVGPVDHTAEELATKKKVLRPAPFWVVSPSQHLASTVRNSPVGLEWSVQVIPNGIDPAQFGWERKTEAGFRRSLGLKPELPVVLVVASDLRDHRKGGDLLASLFSGPMPSLCQVILVGGNSQAMAEHLPSNIHRVCAGYVKSRQVMADLYEVADVFLFTSRAENFPCVILEAMASACCVVATPAAGVSEQIQPGIHGLVGLDFSPAGLAELLRAVLQDAGLRQRMGGMARIRVEREFSEALMIHRHLELYARILRAHGGTSAAVAQ
jgi:glycosyltransferase involved in cell wall biosynthesis